MVRLTKKEPEVKYEPAWKWNPVACPADRDFIDWMNEKDGGLRILHVGTGGHHRVGLDLHDYNSVLGITYSPEEYQCYIDLVTQDKYLPFGYQCMFADIYRINYELLPSFDIITLFHLGEIHPYPEIRSDIGVIRELVAKLDSPGGGYILAYAGTAARPVLPIFEGELKRVGEYSSLRIYKPRTREN